MAYYAALDVGLRTVALFTSASDPKGTFANCRQWGLVATWPKGTK
jgi:hypothetical protein